jgi:hypothetical protein
MKVSLPSKLQINKDIINKGSINAEDKNSSR